MASLLPPHDGLLPYWLLLIGSLALFNTIQTYRNRHHVLRTYEGSAAPSQTTAFAARMFGTWTFLSSVVRLYAAFKVDVKEMYVLTLWTFVIALAHFGSEWLAYGTMKAGRGLAPVTIVPVVSMLWMVAQWRFYVG